MVGAFLFAAAAALRAGRAVHRRFNFRLDPDLSASAVLEPASAMNPNPIANVPTWLTSQYQGVLKNALPKGVQLTLFGRTPAAATVATQENNSNKTERADKVAKSRLKKKNRKRHQKSIVLPLNLGLESATVYTTRGFSPDLDGNWLVTQVTHTLKKSGSTTSVELERCKSSF